MSKVLWVSPFGTKWKVHFEKESDGKIFEIKTEAIKEARRMVRTAKEGEITQIIVQKENGQIQTEWTYGTDPYPPAG
jgi:hypothetical protein